jgi:nucleotide-binding universal stress UspA family protein
MTIKTILVHCDGDKTMPQRAGIAADLATKLGSHLVGLHVRPPFQPPAFYDGTLAMDELYRLYEDNLAAEETAAMSGFTQATEGRNIDVARRVVDGLVDKEVTRCARYADLIVVGQASRDAPAATPRDLPEVVALHAGRPVLVVPYIGVQKPVGKTVLLCWKAGRESARATRCRC